MAAVQSHMNGFEPVVDDLPGWKKELILRRRANAKFHGEETTPSGGKGTPHSPTTVPLQHILPCSVQGQAQLSVHTVQGPTSSLRSVRVHKNSNSQSVSKKFCEGECNRADEVLCGDKIYDGDFGEKYIVNGDMRGPSAMHHKGVPSSRSTSQVQRCNNEEEEFEYGPGIVSRLKNRYLSLALREAKSRASLRKYSSLEDLLDDGGHERGRSSQKDRPLAGGNVHKDSMKRARSMDSLAFRRVDNDKVPRSHSSGALRHALEKKEIIIIENPRPKDDANGISGRSADIQPTQVKKQSSLLDEEELPAPDTVKQVKQIFEPSSRSSRGTVAAKVASYKATQAKKYPQISQKPSIMAKPTQIHSKPIISPKIESCKAALKQGRPLLRPSPKSILSVRAVAPQSKRTAPVSPLSPVTSGLTPISASVTSPQTNGELSFVFEEKPPSRSDEFASSSPRYETRPRPHSPPPSLLPLSPTPTHKVNSISLSMKSDMVASHEKEIVLHENKKNREKSSMSAIERSSDGTDLPSSGSSPECDDKCPREPHGLKEPWGKRGQETKILEEKMETESSAEATESALSSSVLEVIRAAEAKNSQSALSPLGLKTTKGKDGRTHESSPLVFNFSKRTDTPDYIENDGVDLSKRQFLYKREPGYVIMPGYDGKNDSSTDGDDDGIEDSLDSIRMGIPPPPCNITFEGEGVIINGRSNLQRQPRTKKLEVSFEMLLTSVYKYPSETCLAEEFDASSEVSSHSSENHSSENHSSENHSSENHSSESHSSENNSSSSPNAFQSAGGLASYTPSQLKLRDSFELGVSRNTTQPHPPTPPKAKEPLEKELLQAQDHLRPADETQTVTWSEESAPDMLF